MKLWIDTDCGVDDSTAILLCLNAPDVDVVGISCIAGNTSLKNVSLNVRRTLKVFGGATSKIPVYEGFERNLLTEPAYNPSIHGNDGLGDIDYDKFGVKDVPKASSENAITALIQALDDNPGMSILALGPLTNIAAAVRMRPSIIDKIGHLFYMGGAEDCHGNVTQYAEFNVYGDPEAAVICFTAIPSNKITISTWTLTLKHAIHGDTFREVFCKDETVMQRWLSSTWAIPIAYDAGHALMADPIAAFVASYGDKAIIDSEKMSISIPLHGEMRGATVSKPDPAGIRVIKKINFELYCESLKKLANSI